MFEAMAVVHTNQGGHCAVLGSVWRCEFFTMILPVPDIIAAQSLGEGMTLIDFPLIST